MITPPISKMISSVTPILLSACSTAEEVDQALIIAVKFLVDFVTFLVVKLSKCISNLSVPTDFTSTIPATYTASISLEWIQFTSTMQSCIFPVPLYETIGRSEKTF